MAKDLQLHIEGQTVKVSGTCTVTGKLYEVTVPRSRYDEWRAGALIQNVLPHHTPDEREFLITKLTPDEFEQLFGEE